MSRYILNVDFQNACIPIPKVIVGRDLCVMLFYSNIIDFANLLLSSLRILLCFFVTHKASKLFNGDCPSSLKYKIRNFGKHMDDNKVT